MINIARKESPPLPPYASGASTPSAPISPSRRKISHVWIGIAIPSEMTYTSLRLASFTRSPSRNIALSTVNATSSAFTIVSPAP